MGSLGGEPIPTIEKYEFRAVRHEESISDAQLKSVVLVIPRCFTELTGFRWWFPIENVKFEDRFLIFIAIQCICLKY